MFVQTRFLFELKTTDRFKRFGADEILPRPLIEVAA